ncbi:hypothetical protein GCM10010095_14160 [Streptomyces anthocyanicus]|uniref:hypothetical protein n=2 Tax=Streptomyces anthocyanicus TaxID=68174 RepID=UPI00167125CE|nr:hypothetical protein [Streptomyces anthocyanicus]GGL30185.1 hypothetical protein GCM10010095_14160 [Streptomyces anthocyanicus]
MGKWAKSMRDAAKLADQVAAGREAGKPVGSVAGALTEEWRRLLGDVDPGNTALLHRSRSDARGAGSA